MKHYALGAEEGAETWWYEDGEKSWEVTWKKGRMEGPLTEWYENGQKMSETLHVAGLREGLATGWFENGTKAYETVYFEDEEVALKEWLETGEEVKPPPEAVGRIQVWKEGELEKIYPGKPEETVYAAFGEPDKAENGAWVFEGIKLDGGDQTLLRNVRFTFKSGKVESVKVDKPNPKPKPEPKPQPEPEPKKK